MSDVTRRKSSSSTRLLEPSTESLLKKRNSSQTHKLSSISDVFAQTEWSWIRDKTLMDKIKKGEYLIDGTDNESIRCEDTASSEDDEDEKLMKEIIEKSKSSLLESVGPPKILQYVPESKKTDVIQERSESPEYVVDDIKDISKFMQDFNVYIQGNNPCEFCKAIAKPWPSIEQQEGKDPKELYCCADYREYVEALFEIHNDKMAKNNDLISIKPHPKSRNKKDIKLAKERARQRAEERQKAREKEEELWKKEQQLLSNSHNHHDSLESSLTFIQSHKGTSNLDNSLVVKNHSQMSYAMRNKRLKSPHTYHDSHESKLSMDIDSRLSKQIRSINYQLSNSRFVKDGWTVRVPSPFAFEDVYHSDDDEDVLVPVRVSSSLLKAHEKPLMVKFYKNGNVCMILFPDGTGNVYYKDGGIAITITLASRGMHIFTVFSESEYNPVILGMFDPYGNAYCNYLTGNLRLNLTQTGGIEFDDDGTQRKRRWLWWDYRQHIHAPPIQPVIFMLNHNLSIKIHSQQKIYLSFCSEAQTLNFCVGSKLQVIKPEQLPQRFKLDPSETFLVRKNSRIKDLLRHINDDLARSAVTVRTNVTKLPKIISSTESFLTTLGHYKQSLTNYTSQYAQIEKQAKQTIMMTERKITKRSSSKAGSRFVQV